MKEKRRLKRRFDRTWRRLAAAGTCDGFGGAEYRRCWNLYRLAAVPISPMYFIAAAANEPPHNPTPPRHVTQEDAQRSGWTRPALEGGAT
jgi:hypothetical protein